MLDGWSKADPPTKKMLPVEADVPEYMASLGRLSTATILDSTIGDLALITFYYLLRVGEYTCKATRQDSTQTVQFKFEDITFFKRNTRGQLHCPNGARLDDSYSRRGNIKTGQPKKWLEGRMCIPRNKW